MRQHRVRELRLQQGLTVRGLAAKAGLSHSYITRLEKGERVLSVENAEKLAKGLGVTPSEVLNLAATTAMSAGFSEEAEPYELTPDDLIAIPLGSRDNVLSYKIKSSALDAVGINIGDLVLLDISQDAVDRIEPLDLVIAQHYGVDGEMSAVTIIRQFVPPALLVTNSRTANAKALNVDTDSVAIKGVIRGIHSRPAGRVRSS